MWWPLQRIGSEIMPELNEGDFLYMPSLSPGVAIGKAREVLQQTDRLIATVPEVLSVHGKLGRADIATDPAPLTMIETAIQPRPEAEWRAGMTMADIRAELDRTEGIQPIRNRIDMLAPPSWPLWGSRHRGLIWGDRADRIEVERIVEINPDRHAAALYNERARHSGCGADRNRGIEVSQPVEGL